MSLPICFLLLISVACGICQAQTHVYLFDQHSKFFNPVLETVDLNPSTLSVFLSSLLGTQPAVSSDQIAYDKVCMEWFREDLLANQAVCTLGSFPLMCKRGIGSSRSAC